MQENKNVGHANGATDKTSFVKDRRNEDTTAAPENQSHNAYVPKYKKRAIQETLDANFKPLQWVIQDITYEGGTLNLVGKKGLGKTVLALQMALSISTGGTFLGRFQAKKGKVLFLELEISERKMKHRLSEMGITEHDGIDFVYSDFPRGDEAVEALRFEIETNAYQFIVIDTLPKLYRRGHDSNSYDSTYDFLGPIRNIANKNNCVICWVMHPKKGQVEDINDSTMGSVGIVGNSDVNMYLLRSGPRAKKAVLDVSGNDIEPIEIPVEFYAENGLRFTATDDDPRIAKLSPDRKRILDLCEAPNGVHINRLIELSGKTRENVYSFLSSLVEAGLVEKSGKATYRALTKLTKLTNTPKAPWDAENVSNVNVSNVRNVSLYIVSTGTVLTSLDANNEQVVISAPSQTISDDELF